jgi:dihydroflavonol-4-reductase
MNRVLVTGASSLLGYHVVKRLNEQGIRPRVLELSGSDLEPLQRLQVDRVDGDLEDIRACVGACTGVDTLFHLAFKVSVGGGQELIQEMEEINVAGTQRLLNIAASNGVERAVVASSALAIGVNRRPEPLNEDASWQEHSFNLPYAQLRRAAEQKALAMAKPGFAVMAVCPSFTMGPDDPVGAPANKLLKSLAAGKLRFTLPVGFGCLDVRDFADGVVRAAQHGVSGQRYLLSGHNVTTNELLAQASAIAGVRPPKFTPPKLLLKVIVAALRLISRIRGKPAPVDPAVLQLIGRYAWYDTTRARTQLGWQPRPLQDTLTDTIDWLRAEGAAPAGSAARAAGK